MEDINGIDIRPLYAGEDYEFKHEADKVRPCIDAHPFLGDDRYILCCKQLLSGRIQFLIYPVTTSVTKLSCSTW